MSSQPHYRQVVEADIQRAMQALLKPGKGYVGCKEVLEALVRPGARIGELSSLPLGGLGQRLMALRYFIANGADDDGETARDPVHRGKVAGAARGY